VETLTLVPRPIHPFETWQAVTSPPTLEKVPAKGWGAVMWLKHHSFVKEWWDRYAEIYEANHADKLAPGEKRMLVVSTSVADTYEEALEAVRPGHDEFWKFLGPYGWSRGYMGENGRPAQAGLIPTLEESLENKTWLVGTAEQVAEGIAFYRDALGGLENLTLFPNMPGDRYDRTAEQMTRLAEDVLPLL